MFFRFSDSEVVVDSKRLPRVDPDNLGEGAVGRVKGVVDSVRNVMEPGRNAIVAEAEPRPTRPGAAARKASAMAQAPRWAMAMMVKVEDALHRALRVLFKSALSSREGNDREKSGVRVCCKGLRSHRLPSGQPPPTQRRLGCAILHPHHTSFSDIQKSDFITSTSISIVATQLHTDPSTLPSIGVDRSSSCPSWLTQHAKVSCSIEFRN